MMEALGFNGQGADDRGLVQGKCIHFCFQGILATLFPSPLLSLGWSRLLFSFFPFFSANGHILSFLFPWKANDKAERAKDYFRGEGIGDDGASGDDD